MISAWQIGARTLNARYWVRVCGWVKVMVEFGTSSASWGGVIRLRVLSYGFGVRSRKVKSRDCALASDLV